MAKFDKIDMILANFCQITKFKFLLQFFLYTNSDTLKFYHTNILLPWKWQCSSMPKEATALRLQNTYSEICFQY